MLEEHEQNGNPKRKFAWADKWIKMTGERAKIDAKANDTYIIYELDGILVKEYPDGKIIELEKTDGVN